MTNEDLQIYFSEHCTVADNVIRLGSPQLSREDYLKVKKLLESRGGKWKGSKTSGFVFDSDATLVYTSICDGDLENKKNAYQFFPTPDNIADLMVERLDVDKSIAVWGMDIPVVLEPSAGRGSLIKAFHRKYPFVPIEAWEINPDCWHALEQLEDVVLVKEDFLNYDSKCGFDYIIANPPFAKNADIIHFRKMYSVLKAGGHICCIISSHALESNGRTESEFKDWLYSLHPMVEELPAGTFKDAGTDVRTYMISLVK